MHREYLANPLKRFISGLGWYKLTTGRQTTSRQTAVFLRRVGL